MKCVKRCHFTSYKFHGLGDLNNSYYCDLYEVELKKRQMGVKFDKFNGNVQLFEIVRCDECENKETIYYTKLKDKYHDLKCEG